MELSTVQQWWAAFRRRSIEWSRPGADPAEMGTAFGLDASFAWVASEPLDADTMPGVMGVSWEERLARRGL